MRKIFCTFIICSLLNQSIWALDIGSLSDLETTALEKIGLSPGDLEGENLDAIKDRLRSSLDQNAESLENALKDTMQEEVDKKVKEIEKTVDREVDDLKKEAMKTAGGYALSTISLLSATLIAPQAIMVCKTKPSAVVFAGSAAIYVLQEMRTMKALKLSQLAELDVVTGYSIDKDKSIKENKAIVQDKVDRQVGYLKAYKNTIDHGITALKKKGKNAKIVSAGFLSSSALAAAEQLDWFSGGGSCITQTNIEKNYERMNFSKDLDSQYQKLIADAKTSQDRWNLYYEWEATKRGEAFSYQEKNFKSAFYEVSADILISAINVVSAALINEAFAQSDTKKVTVAKSLKDNKMADWVMDLDKLGIVGGAAINIVAYMAGFELTFLKSIIASGTSRSIAFGAQGALALSAGVIFENSAKEFQERSNKVEKVINNLHGLVTKGLDFLVLSDTDARNIQKFANKLGVSADKLITEMTINEAAQYLKDIKNAGKNKIDKEFKDALEKIEDQVNEKLDKEKEKLKDKEDALKEKIKEETPEDLENKKEKLQQDIKEELKKIKEKVSFVFDFFMPMAFAQSAPFIGRYRDIDCPEKKTCGSIVMPKVENPRGQGLNQYLNLQKNYAEGVVINNEAKIDHFSNLILTHKTQMENIRNTLFSEGMKKQNLPRKDYAFYEDLKLKEEQKRFDHFYDQLSSEDQKDLMQALSPYGKGTMMAKASTPLTGQERMALEGILKRLPATVAKKNTNVTRFSQNQNTSDSPNMQFYVKEEKIGDYNFGDVDIHAKEANLFDVIHNRYLNVYRDIKRD